MKWHLVMEEHSPALECAKRCIQQVALRAHSTEWVQQNIAWTANWSSFRWNIPERVLSWTASHFSQAAVQKSPKMSIKRKNQSHPKDCSVNVFLKDSQINHPQSKMSRENLCAKSPEKRLAEWCHEMMLDPGETCSHDTKVHHFC